MIKELARAVIRLIPGKLQIVRLGALLPCSLKNRWSVRVFGALLRSTDQQTKVTTNLGIKDKLRMDLSADTLPVYLFGKPSIYSGERGPLFLAKHFAQSCSGFVDIGANIGYYTYFIRTFCKESLYILSFEPNKDLFEFIQTTVRENDLQGISLYSLGISDKKGQTEFYLDQHNPTMGSLLQEFAANHKLEKCVIDRHLPVCRPVK